MSRQFDDLQLGSTELFCLAAELSSFTAAATSGGYCRSEDLLGGVTLARHGAGLLQTYFIVEEDLQRGSM